MHRYLGLVHRQLQVVGADAVPVRVGVGEHPAEQHLVRRDADARYQRRRLERGLLDLGEEVVRVAVEHQPPDPVQRVVVVRPHLGQVERVEPVPGCVGVRHHLHVQRPGRVVAAGDGVEQVAAVEVGVLGDLQGGLCGGEVRDALLGLEVVLDPEALAGRVDPQVRVRAEAVHVAPGARGTPVGEQEGDLVRGLGVERPEVPLHVVVAQSGVRPALLRADEVGELHRVADEEDGRVVADQVVVALGGVELQGEPARVAYRVRRPLLTGHCGQSQEHLGGSAGLEHRRLGERRHVVGDLEVAERAAALGVHVAFGYPFPVEVRHLLDEVMVVQHDRAVRPDGEREGVARGGCAMVGGGDRRLLGHQ